MSVQQSPTKNQVAAFAPTQALLIGKNSHQEKVPTDQKVDITEEQQLKDTLPVVKMKMDAVVPTLPVKVV